MNAPFDHEHIPREVKDGIVTSILGGLAMTARLLLSTTPVSPGWVIRRVLAAGITSAIAGFAIQEHIQNPGLRMACIGGIGYASPEALDFFLAWLKKRGEKELGAVSGKSNGKKAKAKRR